MRQRRVAEGKGLGTGLSTTAKYVRRTASGAAGNGLGITIKYLRRIRNGAAGNGLGTKTNFCDNNCRLICRVVLSCCGSVAWPQDSL